MPRDLLVKDGLVLQTDGSLQRVDIQIRDGTIATVGAGLTSSSERVIDATAMIVMPGLVNAHMHSAENFNPGLYENLPLDLWFVRSHQVRRLEPPSREAIYVRTLLGAVLMLRTGTTAVVDFLYEAPEITLETLAPVVEAYRDAGLRATILLGVADRPFSSSLPLRNDSQAAVGEATPPDLDRIMELASSAVERWHEPNGLIGIGLGPSAPQRCSPELLSATMNFAREHHLVWQTHVLETKTQALTSREWHGKSFVEVLDERGLLGPTTTLVHTVWLTDRDIELMSQTETTAVHCLLSNLRLGDGVARIPALRDAGVRVALGTDGRGCDETLDMLELMKMVTLVQKARGGDFRQWLTAEEAFTMGTANGSVCTGHGEQLGRIEKGARGDLVLLASNSLPFTPLHDPMRQLVFGAASSAVHTVVVDGRIVVEEGRLVGIGQDRLLDRVRAHTAEATGPERVDDAAPFERLVQEVYDRAERADLGIDSYVRS